jgi:hypothetical protein
MMKTQNIILATLLSCVFLIGCKKENDDPLSGVIVDGKITAKVENASEFRNVVAVKFMAYDISVNRHVELARGNWKNGGFTIEPPKTLDPNFLHPLIRRDVLLGGYWIPGITEIQPTLTISNENVRVDNNYFVGVDKDGKEVASFGLFMEDKDDTHANFTYVDSDVTISGYKIEEFQIRPNRSERNITTYSVSWEKGWNVWCLSRCQSDTGSMFITEDQWSTTPIRGLKWYGLKSGIL